MILAAQKSGMVYALDPDDQGKVLWKIQVGPGSMGGGMQYGFAADESAAYVPNGNRSDSSLSALQIADGKMIWHKPAPPGQCGWGAKGCSGVGVSGRHRDSRHRFLRIGGRPFARLLGSDGSVVWNFDTAPGNMRGQSCSPHTAARSATRAR